MADKVHTKHMTKRKNHKTNRKNISGKHKKAANIRSEITFFLKNNRDWKLGKRTN